MLSPNTPDPAEAAFARLADSIFDSYCASHPGFAAEIGLHEYDGQIGDFRRAALEGRAQTIREQLAQLAALDPATLPPVLAHDHALAAAGLAQELWSLVDVPGYRQIPLTYLAPIDASRYVKRRYAPLADRVVALTAHLAAIPGVLAAAQANLDPVLPRPPLTVSLEVFRGVAAYLDSELEGALRESAGPGEELVLPAGFAPAHATALAAVRAFIAFLEARLPAASEDFAIGAERYGRMLAAGELVDLPVEAVLEVGRQNLAANHARLQELAAELAPGEDVPALMARLAADHPTVESLIPDTAALLEDLRAFLIAHDLISIPSAVRCRVRPTPGFLRWGFAFMDPPGPFETQATEAYYYVTTVDPAWPADEQEAWLRRFEYAVLRNTSVHEAYPGHYVHFLHAQAPMSRLRKLFGSYALIEGWAHYCEQMMVEQGLGGADNRRLEVAQLQDALLRNCRYLVSIGMHTQGMSLAEATRFIQENAYYEEMPAAREAIRGTFDPGYLNYCLGKLMLLKLREDYAAACRAAGRPFTLRGFHDAVLSYGAPPVPLLRRSLLGPGAIL